MDIHSLMSTYKNVLIDNIIPFWMTHSPDLEYGGYFTCLNRNGDVFDHDKFTWLQCRQVWTFAMLYNQVEKRQAWLDFAMGGAEFLEKNGRDSEGNWYFSLDRTGKPLVQPYNIFSDCFAAMAFGQLYKATKNKKHAEIAKKTFLNILRRQDNPKGKYAKAVPGGRDLIDFALPMILANLVLELEHILEPSLVNKTISNGIDIIMNKFYHPEFDVILENVATNGAFVDCFEGRLVNPGHGLEAMWFVLDLADRIGDKALSKKAVEVSLKLLEFGWDEQYGGIIYFKDVLGYPPLQLEWDQKLWWVHLEAMVAMVKGYLHSGNEKCMEWFKKLHEYSFNHFADKDYGEWFGYLNRKGEVLMDLKGSKWKGCFHVPRAFYQIWKTLEQIEISNKTKKLIPKGT